MHKLDRGRVDAPSCLGGYASGLQNWDAVGPGEKAQIRESLVNMQGERCAYCECPIASPKGHIEHFFPRSRFPKKIFDWDNLFFSCDAKDTCGRRKDSSATGSYDPATLIKPDVDEPDDYLHFLSDGKVVARRGLAGAQHDRAEETIRIFNLNAPMLQGRRRRALKMFTDTTPDFQEDLAGFSETERQEWIALELQATACDPHCSVIRHFLTR